MTTAADRRVFSPPSRAEETLPRVLSVLGAGRAALSGADGEPVELPPEVHDVLHEVVRAMSRGLAVSVTPHTALLTVHQAADLLAVSPSTVVGLVEGGHLPAQGSGRRRRISLEHVLEHREASRARRRRALDAMVAEAAADGGYDRPERFVVTR